MLGVDDFSKRRGHSYATILINMETHRPIDVLEDRRADTLAEWLRRHPGVEVVCRDRAGAYAEGARDGAPEAIQVADRWHLWHNLCDAVEDTVRAHRADLREPERDGQHLTEPPAAPQPSSPPESRTAVRTHERHAAIHELTEGGMTISQISQQLGLDRKTVRKFRNAATAEQLINGPRFRARAFEDFIPYLHRRWTEGCTDGARLFGEITAQGYRGSERSVRRYLQPLRAALPNEPLPTPPPTVREATRWITSHPGRLTAEESAKLNITKDRSPHLAATPGHVTAFAQMMTGRHGERLDAWLTAVEADDLTDLHSFARGIRRDHAAVLNGLTMSHSSGAVEGNVCRIKALKRQMFGRANLDLLRKRILLST